MPTTYEVLAPRVRILQIITATLIGGVVIFLGFALFTVLQNGQGLAPAADVPLISLMAAVLLIVNAPMAVFVPTLQVKSAVRQIAAGTWRPPQQASQDEFASDAAKLVAVKQSSTIIALALLEGAAFLGCTAFLLEGRVLAVGVVGVALAFMTPLFPTHGRLQAWLEQQLAAVEERRASIS
jgi:hypothetical protein